MCNRTIFMKEPLKVSYVSMIFFSEKKEILHIHNKYKRYYYITTLLNKINPLSLSLYHRPEISKYKKKILKCVPQICPFIFIYAPRLVSLCWNEHYGKKKYLRWQVIKSIETNNISLTLIKILYSNSLGFFSFDNVFFAFCFWNI